MHYLLSLFQLIIVHQYYIIWKMLFCRYITYYILWINYWIKILCFQYVLLCAVECTTYAQLCYNIFAIVIGLNFLYLPILQSNILPISRMYQLREKSLKYELIFVLSLILTRIAILIWACGLGAYMIQWHIANLNTI